MAPSTTHDSDDPATSYLASVSGDHMEGFYLDDDRGHVARAVWRWRLAILVAVIVVAGGTLAALLGLPGSYTASTTVTLDQPQVTAGGQQGLAATQKLLDLMPTYASLVTSDAVLGAVRRDLGLSESMTATRDRVTVDPVNQELALRITATGGTREATNGFVQDIVGQFTSHLVALEAGNGVPPSLRIVVTQLTRPDAVRQDRHVAQTTALAAVATLFVMAALAAAVDYLSPR